MAEQFANSASTTLNGAILPGDLSIVVANGGYFPSSGQFRLLIENEILLATARTGNTLTVTRGQEGTVAQSHNHGVTVTSILTAGAIDQLKQDINRSTSLIVPLVAGFQSVNTTGYTVVGASPALPLDNMGKAGTRNHYFATTLNIPTGTTAEVTLYDVTHAAVLYSSPAPIAGPQTNYQVQELFTPGAGYTVYELWVKAPTNAGGPVVCMGGHIVEIYES